MQALRDLTDFAGLLRQIEAAGIEFAVIGGCAVGAYGRLQGEAVFSADLDLYVTRQALDELLAWAPKAGVQVLKRPRVRALPAAVLEWNGLEVNALTETTGLPDPRTVARTARELVLREPGLVVPVADPFDLLANKLAVNREKDRPHIDVLLRFCEAEVVEAFGSSQERPRHRMAPARRLLDVLKRDTLPEGLAERLLPLAGDAVLLRFLASRAPSAEFARRVIERADPDLRAELAALVGGDA